MRLLAAVLASLATAISLSAQAVTLTTDFSDLWFNPDEEGWGVNLVQQREILFITFFVYNANGTPTWFVGPATTYNGVSQDGVVSFTGPLYTTTGPYFGAASFDENQVGSRQVGTVSFAAGAISVGAIVYSVDGVQVSKNIQRQAWRSDNITGIYVGGSLGTYSGCGGTGDGYFEQQVVITVSHDGGSTLTMREDGSGYTCNYTGGYTQAGRMGQIQGFGTCTDGTQQSFLATEVQSSIQGITMRFRSQFAGTCLSTGRLGGVRRGS